MDQDIQVLGELELATIMCNGWLRSWSNWLSKWFMKTALCSSEPLSWAKSFSVCLVGNRELVGGHLLIVTITRPLHLPGLLRLAE